MASHLSVPSSSERSGSASPMLSQVEGASLPAPNASPTPSPAPPSPAAVGGSDMDTSEAGNIVPHRSHANLSADEERAQFTALYDPTLKENGVFCLLPQKWFESWEAYTGFDRSAVDLLRAQGGVGAPAASAANTNMEDESLGSRRGGGERPGYIDCTPLLAEPPAHVNLSDTSLRSHWNELRKDAQEGTDFTLINYDAFMRLCEWYGGGPVMCRKVVLVGLSQMEIVDLHPVLLILTPLTGPAPGRIALEQRRLKPYAKTALLSAVLDDATPQSLVDEAKLLPRPTPPASAGGVAGAVAPTGPLTQAEARAMVDGRVWRKKGTPAGEAAAQGAQTPAPSGDASASAVAAAALPPEQFVQQWEVVPKAELAQKLEYLEVSNGQEYILEYRLSSQPWARTGSGKVNWSDFAVGDVVDCLDPEGKWFQAEIMEVHENNPVHNGARSVKVHYINWAAQYDEVIVLTPENLQKRFAPKLSWTIGPHVRVLKKKPPAAVQEPDYYSSYGSAQAGAPEVRGAVGLRNLGNTCFMNSTLQCLSNTPGLTEYFTEGKYLRYINRTNPLGFKGKIAEEYGAMLNEIWGGHYSTVTPRGLKQAIGEFCPRFSGYAQQDSSEVLAFLLDGLHEDLNRVLVKPATQPVDSNGRPDEVVAAEAWERHLMRNQSVIVDTFQGQLKSRLVCPLCSRVSITFDPFMSLAVPVPVSATREMLIPLVASGAVVPGAESDTQAHPYSWPLKLGGSLLDVKNDLCEQVNSGPRIAQPSRLPAVSARTILIAEIYQNKIYRIIAERENASKIGKADQIVFYHVPEMLQNVPGQEEVFTTLQCVHLAATRPMLKRFGVPLVLPIPTNQMRGIRMSTLRSIVRAAVAPWLNGGRGWSEQDDDSKMYTICLMERSADTMIMPLPYSSESDADPLINLLETCTEHYKRNRVNAVGMSFALDWTVNAGGADASAMRNFSFDALQLPPHIATARASANALPRKVGLDLSDCLSAHGKEETLRATDKWYCNKCKEHVEATKKIDVFRLPNILIINLKRFVYNAYHRDKIDAYVDFPLENLDMAPFCASGSGGAAPAAAGGKNNNLSTLYDLYAVSNHYGGMGGGHYTAYCKNLVNGRWYNLDDSSATPVANPESVRTAAAYVLFYKRKGAKFSNL